MRKTESVSGLEEFLKSFARLFKEDKSIEVITAANEYGSITISRRSRRTEQTFAIGFNAELTEPEEDDEEDGDDEE